MITPLEFPFAIEPPRNQLLAPLRARVEDLQQQAHAGIRCLDRYSDQGSMLEDSLTLAAEATEGYSARNVIEDLRREAYAARHRRDGYDTWPPGDLRDLVGIFDALALTFTDLARAWRDLIRAEAEAIRTLAA